MPKDNPLMQGLNANTSATMANREPPPIQQAQRVPQTRAGTKLVGGHFAKEVSAALKVIAAENDTTVQDLIAEAINGIFAKYNKPQIATLNRS